MDNKKLLGKRIKELRKQVGYTQEQLAELIDIETSSLSGIESGRHFPSLPTLEKISYKLNVQLMSLFDFNHLQTKEFLKTKIIENIDNIDEKTLMFIYKFFEVYK